MSDNVRTRYIPPGIYIEQSNITLFYSYKRKIIDVPDWLYVL